MIISYESECYSFTDDKGAAYPALSTKGCGCCSSYLPVTQENINQAILEAEKWLETLKALKPFDYPVDCDISKL